MRTILRFRMTTMSEHLACPDCGSGEFWLRPDGKIICADGDCYATMGHALDWRVPPRETASPAVP